MNETVTMISIRWHLALASAIAIALSNSAASCAIADDTLPIADLIREYCIGCHGETEPAATLNLTAIIASQSTNRTARSIEQHAEVWESVLRRLRGRQMPPAGEPRPAEARYVAVVDQLEHELDRAAAQRPQPGRTATLRRLNRTEYQNAIRDLLSINIDASAWVPVDESSHGFDNITVGELSPTLLDRYLTAARKISQLAVGGASRSPDGVTIRVKADITQEEHVPGLPFGTRGGTVIRYTFPRNGDYDIQIRLARDRNEHVEGLYEPHELEVLLDRRNIQTLTITPPPGRRDFTHVDDHLTLRLTATAGPHDLGVTFIKDPSSVIETLRQPYQSHFNAHRHPRLSPAVYQVSITGPFNDRGPGDTPSRRHIFSLAATGVGENAEKAADPSDETIRASRILGSLLRRAWRRPVDQSDIERVLPFYHEERAEADFDAGIEAALSAILVSREFLFRVELDPPGIAPQTAYRISDQELASRLSFFLWSSIPDDELLLVAERGELRDPAVLARQTQRMLQDPRSESLVSSFAAQWLYLRNLESITPDGRLFPDFDDNLRQAMKQETELLFMDVIREDLSVLKLLRPDHIWLNERLAQHYDIPHVYGSRFRRLPMTPGIERGGLLRQASILTVTSYATRTSPVLRGKWILENLLGTPPPPPPANVPALDDNTVAASLPVRERLAAHRAHAACAGCHDLIDPVGFALENFDAIGRWRTLEGGRPVDASGGLPDGSRFVGVGGVESGLRDRPEIFVGTLTGKLLTFALGRGLEAHDAPAVRTVVRSARSSDFRFSALIHAIVNSVPFQMRTSP